MSLVSLHRRIIRCTKCDRLVQWRTEIARVKRRAYRDETYWGRPVPGFGDPKARLVIVGRERFPEVHPPWPWIGGILMAVLFGVIAVWRFRFE